MSARSVAKMAATATFGALVVLGATGQAFAVGGSSSTAEAVISPQTSSAHERTSDVGSVTIPTEPAVHDDQQPTVSVQIPVRMHVSGGSLQLSSNRLAVDLLPDGSGHLVGRLDLRLLDARGTFPGWIATVALDGAPLVDGATTAATVHLTPDTVTPVEANTDGVELGTSANVSGDGAVIARADPHHGAGIYELGALVQIDDSDAGHATVTVRLAAS